MSQKRKISVFGVVNGIFLLLMTLVFIIPLWTTVVTSLVSDAERMRRGMFMLFPQAIETAAYETILKPGSLVYSGYLVTLIRTFGGTAANMLVTSLLAFGMAKRELPGRTPVTFLIYFTMLFSGGLVPTFLVVKYTGLYNSIWALIVPGLVNVWNLFLLRNFFMQIPASMEEAAVMDGASLLIIYLRIVLPLSLASLVTIALFYAVAHWNAWFDALIYTQGRDLMPLQMVLRNIIIASNVEDVYERLTMTPPPLETVKAAAIVVSTVPILLVYPIAQKYFIKGVMIGGVKG